MTVHDDDILDFDFVDDETRELPPRHEPAARDLRAEARHRQARAARAAPSFRAPQGMTPILRLAGFVGFAILVIVLLAVWVQGCAGDDTQTTYENYMADIGAVGRDSQKIGNDLATLLTTPG